MHGNGQKLEVCLNQKAYLIRGLGLLVATISLGFISSLGIQKVRTIFIVLTLSIPAWLRELDEQT